MTEELLESVLISAQDYGPAVSEIEEAGLTQIPSLEVAPPRIAESTIQMECRLQESVFFGDTDPGMGRCCSGRSSASTSPMS